MEEGEGFASGKELCMGEKKPGAHSFRLGPSVEGTKSSKAPAPLWRASSGDLYLLGSFLPLPLETPGEIGKEA